MRSTTDAARNGPRVMTLPSGRRLAWYECGDADGIPCFYSPGTPHSGLAGLVYDRPARRAGLRLISPDRPGYGHSDFLRNRRLLHYPNDIVALADHLGLDRFASVGESGGGPFALALARAIPRRLSSTTVLAGLGPSHEAWVREGMKPQNRRLLALAANAPWLLRIPLSRMGRQLSDPKRWAAFAQRQLASAPAADRPIFEQDPALLELAVASSADAFRNGARGAVHEMALLARPWGFELTEIATHVDLWHGTEDVNVPVGIARKVAGTLPDCSPRIVEGSGHGVGLQHADEILAHIARA